MRRWAWLLLLAALAAPASAAVGIIEDGKVSLLFGPTCVTGPTLRFTQRESNPDEVDVITNWPWFAGGGCPEARAAVKQWDDAKCLVVEKSLGGQIGWAPMGEWAIGEADMNCYDFKAKYNNGDHSIADNLKQVTTSDLIAKGKAVSSGSSSN